MRYLLLLALTVTALADSGRVQKLDNDLRYLIGQKASSLEAAVTVLHPASQEKVSVNGQTPFPLASVFKVPILLEAARQMERGTLNPQTVLTITEASKCIGSGRLHKAPSGTPVSLDKCLRLMMSISDNTATDLVFAKLGYDSVNTLMKELGYHHSDIFMTNRQAWLLSLGQAPGLQGLGPTARARHWLKLPPPERRQLALAAETSNRSLSLSALQRLENASARSNSAAEDAMVAAAMDNLASSEDMAGLLADLTRGKLFQQSEWASYCLDVMAGQRYHTRLPAALPDRVTVYHKTGTLAGIRNDVGIIELPDGSYLVVAVLVKNIRAGAEGRADRLIAEVARLAYQSYR